MILINLYRESSFHREFDVIRQGINQSHLSPHLTLLIYFIPATCLMFFHKIS